ncbi:MAG TPA: MATE family efflux transporter [Thermoanaerobaculia bacterium]|nr:MATE family efflux transporter [Thermoanaerobaculia bacterium]
MSLWRREARIVTRLATPVALTQVSSMLLWTIDFVMVGRIGVEAINAVSLGRLWVMGTAMVAVGLLFGIDPIATQAHGARDRERLGDVLLHGSAMALLASVPLALAWLATEPVLLAFGQDPATVAVAARYVAVQIPALPFFLLFMLLRQYLQARGIVRPAMWIAFGSIAVNAGANAVLIFGLFGAPRLGAVGAGVATALTEVAMLVALVVAVRRHRLQRGARTVLDPRKVSPRRLAEIAVLGAPVAIQIALEYWAFALSSLWAGRLGAVQLAAHSIVLNLASVAFMVPLGISSGATTRVGNLLGAGAPAAAERAARVALALGGGVMLLFAALFVAGRNVVPLAFTPEAAVVTLAATVLPIVAAFELFDGLQVVGAGVLRGMGETRPAAVANFVGYYLLGLPLGWWLGSPARLGLAGIWWGLALGLFAVAVALATRVLLRGPAAAAPVVVRRGEGQA